MKIKVLPKDVVEKIAAGEVIERPVSVVKELVENALDAEATNIEINIAGGGTGFIEVADNGHGMSKDELKIAVQRHATSKISNFEDLGSLKTLGFRGEALPTIAAVSKFTIISKVSDSDEAVKYEIEGGREKTMEPAARPGGTTVRVEDLFFNISARKKFLKTEATEKRHITAYVEQAALARPDTAFKLISDGKEILNFIPSSERERFIAIAGKKLNDKIIEIDFKNPMIGIKGFITSPQVNFSSKNKIYIFVNSRPVFSPLVSHALARGYRSFIPSDRNPACVLNIEINPSLVDVNVHPAKKEVKFVNQQGIHEIVSKVIRSELEKTPAELDFTPFSEEKNTFTKEFSKGRKKSFITGAPSGRVNDSIFKDIDLSKVTKFSFAGPEKEEASEIEGSEIIPHFQWKNKYVVGETAGGVVIIDQHTAWERINYEKLQKQMEENNIESQGNLIPEMLEMESSRAQLVSENTELFKKAGIHISEFGPNMFKVESVPAVYGRTASGPEDMIESILQLIENSGKSPDTSELNDEIIKIIACRASVKSGDKMTMEEMREMVRLLGKCSVPHRCPHGRPVIIKLTEKELDGKFDR